jgi:signal transduction histidine kinase
MHVAVPISVEGQLAGVAYLSQSLQDVSAVLRDMSTRWWASVAAALVLSGVVGLLLSRAISRPLRQLTVAAGRVAEGQLDQQVPVRSRDELGRLSQAFNEMVARLRASRQMQTDFVANVSHELRTPLTSVKGMVETLRDGAVDDLRVRDRFLDTIDGETERLIRLVNDLLLLSRVDSDALALRREAADLASLARATVEQLAPQAAARKVTMRVEMAGDLPSVPVDADRITQVLLNVLDNAIKFSPLGGEVAVSLSAQGGLVRLEVRDQGPGIPADDLPRVGERFYRADRARARTAGGSGLGLAIARALVELHSGRLSIDSEVGRGTTVRLDLPLT